MPEYKEINMKEFYKRLAKTLGVSIAVAQELHKGYATVYTECIAKGESFPLPVIGTLKLIPYKSNLVRKPCINKLVERVFKYRFKFCPSEEAERCRKVAR